MIYQWKSGSRVNVDAQTAGEVCESLEARGMLTPSALVDVSRPDDAPLHECFEWRDDVAAEKYRETQAGYIIRSLETRIMETEPQRAFLSIEVSSGRVYSKTDVLLRDENSREIVLRDAFRELEAFRKKYMGLSELAAIFEAIDSIMPKSI